MSLLAPISVGELIDKITILEIKKSKIQDENKLKNVKHELQKLNDIFVSKVNVFNDNVFKLKNALKDINEKLWYIENAKRQHEKEQRFDNEFVTLARNVYIFNDKRAEIKREINVMLKSDIVEEKEFPSKTKAFYLGHLGMGDHILSSPIVHWLLQNFDEVTVVCRSGNKRNVEMLYSLDPRVKIFSVDHDSQVSPNHGFPIEKFIELTQGQTVCMNGYWNFLQRKTFQDIIYDFPFCFYDELKLPRNYFWDNMKIPCFEESVKLYKENLQNQDFDYVFVHHLWSEGKLFDLQQAEDFLKIDKSKTLIINPNANHYALSKDSTLKFFDLAEKFLNLPLFLYSDALKNASKILVTDSAFFCLAQQLELKSDQLYVTQRPGKPFNWEVFYGGFNLGKRKRFQEVKF